MAELRLVDANALPNYKCQVTATIGDQKGPAEMRFVFWQDIEKAPTIDAVPVVHAENVTPTHSTDMFVCGNCGFTCEITKLIYEDEDHPEVGIPIAFEYDCKYCPDCGAKMEGVEG